MASLIKHASGIYYAQFYDATRRPKRKRFSLRTRNRRTAERVLSKLEADLLLGGFDPWAPPASTEEDAPAVPAHLGDAVEAYLADRAHLRPDTLRTYGEIMRAFASHAGPSTAVAELTPRHVVAWLRSTSTKPVTKRKYVSHLGYLFRWLVERAAMERDVSKEVKLERVPEQAPKAMTPEMVEAFVATARRWPGHDYDWLADLAEANVEMGLRRGELLALRREHVDVEKRVLLVVNGVGFSTKSGKERAIPLSTSAAPALSRRLEEGRPHVFETASGLVTPNGLSHAFRRVRDRAGLPEWASLHSTRHTALTRLAERGVPVEVIRQFAGHSSITVTERYTRMRPDVVREHVLRALG